MHPVNSQRGSIPERSYAFGLASAMFLALHHFADVRVFAADAGYYWALSNPTDFVLFPISFRGYVLPLLLLPLHALDSLIGISGFPSFRILSSLIYAWLLTGPVAHCLVELFGGELTAARRLILPMLLALFFPGLLIYPLSDLPALILLIAGLTLLARAKRPGGEWMLFWAGVCFSASYNIRTVYIVSVLVATPIVLFSVLSERTILKRCAGLTLWLAGLALVAVPQAWINARTHHIPSPLVIALMPTGKPLIPSQLQWGITLQRYETSINVPESPAGVYYLDGAGAKLFDELEAGSVPMTIPRYLQLLVRKPVEFSGLLGRHLINGLDVRDGRVYVLKASSRNNEIAVLNFCVLFTGLMIWNLRTQRTGGLAALVLLAPVLALLPGAVETRFFLPLHVLIYANIAFGSNWTAVRSTLKARPLLIMLAFILCACVFFAVSTTTMQSASTTWPSRFQ